MTSAEKSSDPGEKAAGPAFECRSVTVEFPHKFSRKRIIEDISFLVRSGEFLDHRRSLGNRQNHPF